MIPGALKEYLDFLVEEALDEKLRGGFNLAHFKQLPNPEEQKNYADNTLTQMRCGSSRCSYILSSGKILKTLAYPKGHDIEQNEGEVKAFMKFGAEYVPRIFDYAPDFTWLIVEPARVFAGVEDLEKRTGMSYLVLARFNSAASRQGGANIPELWNELRPRIAKGNYSYENYSVPLWEDLPPLGQELVIKLHHLTKGGLVDITRWDHWGWTSDGRLVCVDPGIDVT